MKIRTLSIIIFLCFVVRIAGFGQQREDFSGSWRMDLKKSKDLPSSFKSLTSYTLHVRQTSDSMETVPEFTGNGQTVKLPPTVYKFDASEVYRVDSLRGSERWIKSSWTTNGQKLIVSSRIAQHGGGVPKNWNQTDVWQLTGKRRLLILITQKFTSNDSMHTERRVFLREK